MPMEQTLSISLKDNTRQSGRMAYVHERSLLEAIANFFGFSTTNADELRDFGEKWSNAKVLACSTTNTNKYSVPNGFYDNAIIDKGFDTCDQKAIVQFIDEDTGARHQVTIPAPKSSSFEKSYDNGYRIIAAKGAEMATELSTITGRTLIFDTGWLIGKK